MCTYYNNLVFVCFSRVNDCILKVNSIDCLSVSKQLVLDTLRSLSSVTFVVKRIKPNSPKSFFITQLQGNNSDHGILLETGLYINKIIPGSSAAINENLNVGDRVLSVSKSSKYISMSKCLLTKKTYCYLFRSITHQLIK